jgi:hypothetical protein
MTEGNITRTEFNGFAEDVRGELKSQAVRLVALETKVDILPDTITLRLEKLIESKNRGQIAWITGILVAPTFIYGISHLAGKL